MVDINQVKARILVVEDECIVAEDLKGCLHDAGYEVIGTAATGEEALRIAEAVQPDLALLDVNLAGPMDGTETAHELQRKFGTPVLYLTAYSDDQTLARMKPTKPRGYLLKPYREKELLCSVDLALTPPVESSAQQQQKLQILEHVPAALVLTDSSETIRYSNAMAQRLFGNEQRIEIGKNIATVFQCIDTSEQREVVEWSAEAPMTVRILDVRIASPTGENIPLEISVSPCDLLGEDDPMLLFMFSDRRGEDVRLQQRLEEQAAALTNEKKEALNDFLSGVSHGVNNSLSGSLGYLHMLREKKDLSKEEEQWISYIEEGCRDAAGLLSRVRGFEVREMLEMDTNVRVSDLVSDVVRRVQDQTQHEIRHTSATYIYEVHGSASLLERALQELLENALHMSNPDDGPIEVAIEESTRLPALPNQHARSGQPRLVIEVRDCGPGVSIEHKHRLFDPFYTSVPDGKVYCRGLGLFIASSIMECHQGSIECENRPGKGALMRLVFPIFTRLPSEMI